MFYSHDYTTPLVDMRAFGTALALCTLVSVSASAKNAADALLSFGLLGTWSWNCAVRPPASGSSRITFFDTLTFQRWLGASLQEGVIEHAERITQEKLLVALKFERIRETDQGKTREVPLPPSQVQHQQILVKAGNRIRILEYRAGQVIFAKNGIAYRPIDQSRLQDPAAWRSSGLETPFLEKCSD
jgi:hypothetical protein